MDNKSFEDVSEKTENCSEGDSASVKQELLTSKKDSTSGHLTNPQTADHLEEWICGDVIWARISGHPFWPGMITIDPNNGLFVKMRKGRGEATSKVYHVQYFSDRGSHSWVSANQILDYEGETKLRDLALTKKKDKKFVGAVPDPKSSNAFKWQCAVKEADDALLTTRQDRLVFFEECFPVRIVDKGKGSKGVESKKENDSVSVYPSTSGTLTKHTVANDKEKETNTSSKSKDQRAVESPVKKEEDGETETANKVLEKLDSPSANLEKKRSRSEKCVSDSDSSPGRDNKLEGEHTLRREDRRTKRARTNNSTTSVKEKLKNRKKKELNSKSTNHVKPKLKYKKKHKNEPGNFEVFFVKSYTHCTEMNSKFADDNDALRVYLLKMWETLNDTEKSKFNEFSAMCS